MWLFQLVPVLCSFLLIAAHFQRAGFTFVALLCLGIPFLLFIKHPLSVRLVQISLLLATVEWGRTLISYVVFYNELGVSWVRLACILMSVAVFTFCSLFILQKKSLKLKYRLK